MSTTEIAVDPVPLDVPQPVRGAQGLWRWRCPDQLKPAPRGAHQGEAPDHAE